MDREHEEISGATPTRPSLPRLIQLPDTDLIALEVSTPAGWHPTDPTVVLLHGVCGCHRSPYMQRLAQKALDAASDMLDDKTVRVV